MTDTATRVAILEGRVHALHELDKTVDKLRSEHAALREQGRASHNLLLRVDHTVNGNGRDGLVQKLSAMQAEFASVKTQLAGGLRTGSRVWAVCGMVIGGVITAVILRII